MKKSRPMQVVTNSNSLDRTRFSLLTDSPIVIHLFFCSSSNVDEHGEYAVNCNGSLSGWCFCTPSGCDDGPKVITTDWKAQCARLRKMAHVSSAHGTFFDCNALLSTGIVAAHSFVA